jgi:alpha-beta hydrolase superfamily lysophospholipase
MTIRAETSTLLTRGIECASYKWIPEDVGKIRGVAVVYHGFGAHSRYPTVNYASSLLAKNGFVVYAMDLPGHGASPGVRGLLTGVDDLVGDGIAIANHAIADSSTIKQNVELPLFLIGSSMGGAIALSVANKMSDKINGVVMLAPMLSLNIGSAARMALGLLSMVVPQLPLIPSSATNSERQYRDAERRAECDNDNLTYKENMR